MSDLFWWAYATNRADVLARLDRPSNFYWVTGLHEVGRHDAREPDLACPICKHRGQR